MSIIYNCFSTTAATSYNTGISTTTAINYNTGMGRIKPKTEEVKTITEEEEEDKQKHLPVFDIKDLDI